VDDKLKQLMKEKLKTFLPPVTTNTPAIQVGVFMPQIRSQPNLTTHLAPVSQYLGW
jgi:hypothetical protein